MNNGFVWIIGEAAYDCEYLPDACPSCGAQRIVALPEPILKEQPDDTTHVCHPAYGGCNRGFALDAKVSP